MDGLGADDVLSRQLELDGCRRKGNDCVPPRPPCEPTSCSKAATSSDSAQ